MNDFLTGLPHLVLQLAVLAFAGSMAALHIVTGSQAFDVVGPIVGFGIGGAMVASATNNAASSSSTTTTTTGRQQVPGS